MNGAAAEELAARKAALRAEVGARRRALDAAAIAEASARIAVHVAALPPYRQARVVGAYLALPREVQTRGFLERAWADGKAVLVPAFRPAAGAYGWAWLRPGERLGEGALHVREPADPEWAEEPAAGLVLVPGVAFDVRGGRLGRGRGWYDRLLTLPAARGAWKAGLAFACQLTPEVPMGPCDVRMDGVVTEDGLAGAKGAGLGGT